MSWPRRRRGPRRESRLARAGGLTLLLTGVLAGIIGYTTIGDGPANPANKK